VFPYLALGAPLGTPELVPLGTPELVPGVREAEGSRTAPFPVSGRPRLLRILLGIRSGILHLAPNCTVQVIFLRNGVEAEGNPGFLYMFISYLFHYAKMHTVCQCNCGEQNALVQQPCFCNFV